MSGRAVFSEGDGKPTSGARRLGSITGQGGEAVLEPVSASAALI